MDILDNYEKNMLRVGVRVSQLSGRMLAKTVSWLLEQLKKKLLPAEVVGRTSIKQLMKKGDKLLRQDVKNAELDELSRVLKRYNIGFSAIQHVDTKDYTLFFKARDEAQLGAGLDAYLSTTVSRNKPEQAPPEVENPAREQPEQTRPEAVAPSQDKATPEDVSFAAPEQKRAKEKPREPQPRSIPKELEEAKAVSRSMQKAREAEREISRSRSRGRER